MVDSPVPVENPKESIANVPVCPVCVEELVNAPSNYMYRKINPDTRWFWCPSCEGHFGYHRMKKKWLIDPFDYDYSNKLRVSLGLPEIKE
jgi:hypothetical protein